MPMVSTITPYTLYVTEDTDPYNPREDDNLGKMLCWHNRYSLGEKHGFTSPDDFLHELLYDISVDGEDTPGRLIFDYLKSGKSNSAKLLINEDTGEAELYEKWFSDGKWYRSSSCKLGDVPDYTFINECVAAIDGGEALGLIENSGKCVILDLYLYDHGGITMNTHGYSDRWDSGQVGWIYADANMLKDTYGEITPNALATAREVLEDEVKVYDCFLRSECYSFRLYEDGEEIDSGCGFYGDIDDFRDELRECLPVGYERLTDTLEEKNYGFNIDEYLDDISAESDDLSLS
ncbi:MAG TPA: hypothetical protein PLT66_04705 [Bacillota bacterium]|nr:hypothetical protein [Bacillota bacterium]